MRSGVSSFVRGILNEVRENILQIRSVLACTGHPLSKPLQSNIREPKKLRFAHKRGYDHLAAVSFKSDTTMTVAA